MKMVERAAKLYLRGTLCWVAVVCAPGIPLAAQGPTANAPMTATGTIKSAAPARFHGTMELEGPWRFQVGDDSRWADPGFDDSAWATVVLSSPLTEQGFDAYSGYGWYRLRVQAQQLAQLNNAAGDGQLDLLVAPNSVGQLAVYVGGVEAGHTKGMTANPSMYASPPLEVHLPQPGADGTMVIAIRSWAGSGTTIQRGLVDKVELGARDDIADSLAAATGRLWNQQLLAKVLVTFVFFCVAGLGGTLYLAQRKHSEYLWLALLSLTVAAVGANECAWGLELMPQAVFWVTSLWFGRVFMAVTMEFVLRFTESEYRRIVRVVQICVLLLPVLALLHLQQAYEYSAVSAQIVFSALVTVLLFRAWRRGRPDAGVMLLPFFLAVSADSLGTVLDWAASKHWIAAQFVFHRFHIGPVEFPISIVSFLVFLFSLLAVIFYRFIHVSQEEQRSAAEIEAARSVQALLIPTQLPSNHNFMLESAYLPVNGVGGDFFQVLPLEDGSMVIVVGDVSGKGLQAAMNASTLVGALRNELSHDPATVLNRLNNVLLGAVSGTGAGQKPAVSFATCVCARIYPDGSMTIANAGHLHPYRDGREMDLAADLPLGVVANMQYAQAEFQLNVGDRLIFLSDGVVEATDAQGELFGFERTQQVSNESARYIAQTAKHFGQTDDITVVSIYFAARGAHRKSEKLQPQA
ncbi:MAG TPA: SpoIIE family protein phosphatase [Terracidiphilus sp.]|nr:SpoIIE family protein phosphatase [Terracidiphilus sp.]